MNKEYILQLLSKASDEDLMMSMKDCHIKGLHSIVLYCDKYERLLRLYMTTPNHQMHNNMRDDLVINLGVHNHRYDLQLTRVHGNAANITYRLSDNRYSNLRVDVYKYYNKDSYIKQDRAFLRRKSITLIGNTFMDKSELHTVFVRANETASWLVQEGFEVKDHTLLYTNSDVKCAEYTRFESAKAVRDFVSEYYEMFGE